MNATRRFPRRPFGTPRNDKLGRWYDKCEFYKECDSVKRENIFVLLFVLMLSLVGCGNKAASIGIIGGADGPTAIFLTSNVNWVNICSLLGVIAAVILIVLVIRRNKK